MIGITARAGAYRKGLIAAAERLSPEEAVIIADLERNGLQVPQLHDVLCGGHVLVDDPRLYEDWRFAKVSHPRVSSHHHDIDKTLYPDIGMRGNVVREKLHGRTAQGTWVQLEKTPAAFGKNKLPGLGRSAATTRPVEEWLADLMRPVRTRPALVAHSWACGPALRFAVDHPDRISGLVLISPAFLQGTASRLARSGLAAAMMRRMSAADLARTLGVPEGAEVESAAADLHRGGVARRVVTAMRTDVAERTQARALLDRVSVPVQIIVGSADPLVAAVDHPVAEIAGAGHYPQLTHPSEVARQLGAVSASMGG